MIRRKKPQVFFDSDDEEDIDLFCRIEQALQDIDNTNSVIELNQRSNIDQERSRLAEQFPTLFIPKQPRNDQNNENYDENQENDEKITKDEIADFHNAFRELQNKIAYVNQKQKELDRDTSWITKEKKELEREKKRVEVDKKIMEANLSNVELLEVRKKYKELKAKYNEEKAAWMVERQQLIDEIDRLKSLKPQDIKPPEKENSLHVFFEEETENSNPIIQSGSINQNKSSNSESNTKQRKSPSTSKKKKDSKILKLPLHPNYKLNLTFNPGPVIKEEMRTNNRKLLRYRNNLTATLFPNGTRKMKYKDHIFIFYSNGDTAEEFKDGARAYRYNETGAIELQLPDKTIMYEFANGQRETHYPNGDKEITFDDGKIKIIHPDGNFEIINPKGSVERFIDGHIVKTIEPATNF